MTLLPIMAVLCATPVAAQDWSVTFPASAVASQLDAEPAAILVVAEAGQPLQSKATGPEGKTAKELYDEQYIGFADVQIFDTATRDVLDRWIAPYQGKFHKPLETDRFFELVGRPDLVTAYQKRNRVRLSIGLGGAGLMLGGGGLIAWGLIGNCSKIDVANDRCLAHDTRPVIAGGALAGAGLLAVLVASVIDPNPVDGPTERELADTYNKRLRRELGLQGASRIQAPPPTSLAAAELSFEF